ncbi:MAG: Zn-dependent alcohol dehydrogenase [Chloroflexota bacterium]
MKMKAAILNDYQQPLSIEEVEIDPPKAGEVRVKIGATGVCHSDYHVMKGEWRYGVPMILGHEAAGHVESVGAGVKGLKEGDTVGLSFRPHCGHCRMCTQGRSVLCEGYDPAYRFTMLDGTSRVHRGSEDLKIMARMGSFAEYAVMTAEQVIKVETKLPIEELCLIGCAVTTGVGAVVNTAKVPPGASAAVIGCGGVGLNVIQGLRLAGASTIIAVDLLDNKLDYALQFGATHAVSPAKGDPVEQVREITGGGVDYAFEVIGNFKTVEQIIGMTRSGGTACIVGMAPQGQASTFDPLLFVQKETRLLGSWYGSSNPRNDFERFVKLTEQGKLNVGGMISRRYTLDEINEGYDRLGRGEVARGVVVFPD